MISVKILGKNRTIMSRPNIKLLDILIKNNEFVESPCGGRGNCGRCKIKHISGELPPITEDEKRFLSDEEISNGIRLACLIRPKSDIIIDIMEQEQNYKVLAEGYVPKFNRSPAIWKRVIDIEKPTSENPISYEELFKEKLGVDEIEWDVLRTLKMRSGIFTAVYNEEELIGLEYGDTFDNLYGIAVDIGTTTVVASLIDLNTGEEIDSEAEINPQKIFGQDVLTRITYVIENGDRGIKDLQDAIVNSLNKMISNMCSRKTLNRDMIYEMSVAANSTMMHILLGIEPISLGKSPYSQIFSGSRNVPAIDIGLNSMSKFARLNCLPSVSSYIGSDVVAGAYVSKLHSTDKKVLFVDMGTNGEIILSDAGKLVSCSCAAGPALEGMNISCGMRAADGAIEDIKITEDKIILDVIGDKEPIGICGSGILAVVREMKKHGIIDERGSIIKPKTIDESDYRQKYIIKDGNKRSVKIADGNNKILVSQGDVRQVQLAKTAILSGFMALVRSMEIKLSELDEVVVAGQFGAHLSAESLVMTGILPKEVEDKIKYIGNSSKTGAYLSLISLEARKQMCELAENIEYIELSVLDGYEKLFAECSRFK